VEISRVKWGKDGNEPADNYMLFMEMVMRTISYGQDYSYVRES
jgi:hypothetical protein